MGRLPEHEKEIVDLIFATTMTEEEARIRSRAAKEFPGVKFILECENKYTPERLDVRMEFDSAEILTQYSAKLAPLLVEAGIWHKDSLTSKEVGKYNTTKAIAERANKRKVLKEQYKLR